MWDGLGHEGWSGANHLSRSNGILKNIYPRQKQFWPGTKQVWPGLKQICPGAPHKSVPIRLNVYEEELSLIGTKFGSPEVLFILSIKDAQTFAEAAQTLYFKF
jgi:hypothetical protein